MKAILYKTPICPRCNFTVKRLNMESELRLIDDYPLIKQELLAKGVHEVPYVQITTDSGSVVDAWHGLKIKKIDEWNNKLL